jgi:hypothetical protein
MTRCAFVRLQQIRPCQCRRVLKTRVKHCCSCRRRSRLPLTHVNRSTASTWQTSTCPTVEYLPNTTIQHGTLVMIKGAGTHDGRRSCSAVPPWNTCDGWPMLLSLKSHACMLPSHVPATTAARVPAKQAVFDAVCCGLTRQMRGTGIVTRKVRVRTFVDDGHNGGTA